MFEKKISTREMFVWIKAQAISISNGVSVFIDNILNQEAVQVRRFTHDDFSVRDEPLDAITVDRSSEYYDTFHKR